MNQHRTVIVTRPEHDAASWVDALRQHGLNAQALPLMAIGACASPATQQALERARAAAQTPGHYRAIMFVSGNAAQYFFASNRPPEPAHSVQADPELRVWAPGPGTAQALLRLGVASSQIDQPPADAAQFESETLWQVVQGQIRAGDKVLIVRGDTAHAQSSAPALVPTTQGAGREWLSARLREAGAEVELLAVYQRQMPHWTTEQQQLADSAASDGSIWLFSSSEAVANLQQLLPNQDWQQGRALATHDRIAQQARNHGFGQVAQSRPALQAVIASIESMA